MILTLEPAVWSDRLKRLQDLVIRHIEESQNIQKLEYDKPHRDVKIMEREEVMHPSSVIGGEELLRKNHA